MSVFLAAIAICLALEGATRVALCGVGLAELVVERILASVAPAPPLVARSDDEPDLLAAALAGADAPRVAGPTIAPDPLPRPPRPLWYAETPPTAPAPTVDVRQMVDDALAGVDRG